MSEHKPIAHPRIVRDANGQASYAGRVLPPGPRHDEPDFVEFAHAGFPCVLNRNNMGAWCGYVGVPSGHPWHSVDYDGIDAAVHGGVTWSEMHVPGLPADTTWEVDGVHEVLWWVGFDCIHAGDVSLSDLHMEDIGLIRPHPDRGAYRTMQYARGAVESLAMQAADRRSPEVISSGTPWRATDSDTAFASPFGAIRQCIDCGCLVGGGPTRCGRCAKEAP